MQTAGQFFGGGALVAIWKKLPIPVWFVIAAAIGAVTAAEITVHLNVALNSGAVEAGKGAQGHAQAADPNDSLDRYHDRRPVAGAAALLGAEVAEKAGNAGKAGAEGQAMSESVEDIRAKLAQGLPLSTTERLQLIKVETALAELHAKEAEARTRAAEAKIKEAESTAAAEKAKADKAIAVYVQCFTEHVGTRITMDTVLGEDPCRHVRPN